MEIKLTDGSIATIDPDDYELVKGYRWRLNRDGYAIATRTETIFMHRLVNGTPDDAITDHINRDRLNNTRANLRTSDKSRNALNSHIRARQARSGFRGVCRVNRRWRAVITVDGRQEHLGYYDTPEEASEAYGRRRDEILGAPWNPR